MFTDDDGTIRGPVAVIAVVGTAAILVVSLVFMGGQTARILSTVGSPIGNPGGAPTDSTSTSNGDATSGSDAVPAGAVVDVTRPDLFVVRTGSIDLEVPDVVRAVDEAGHDVELAGGYVSASQQTGEGSDLKATVTYRIPVATWEDAVTGLRALATKVASADTHTEDVTAKVVDLDARIANLRVTEVALQAIMAKATQTSDVLDVQAELTKVRGEIEEATAQRQRFRDQAAFSTLTATFRLTPVPAVAATQNRFDPQAEAARATARLVRVAQRAMTAGIWFAIVWLPILVVLVLAAGIVVAVAIRVRRVADRSRRASGSQA